MDSVNVTGVLLRWVSPFGNPRIKAHLRLPVAYRSLSRPSSALSAKAFPLRPLQLNLRRRSTRVIVSLQTGKLKCSSASPLKFRPASLGSKFVGVRLSAVIITRIRKISVLLAICSRSFDLIPTINVKTNLYLLE